MLFYNLCELAKTKTKKKPPKETEVKPKGEKVTKRTCAEIMPV